MSTATPATPPAASLPAAPTASRAYYLAGWAFVIYLGLVILFGAWVRISGSGAGCGNNWPTCNGEVLPQAPSQKTVIEFTHRLTSGLSGLWGLGMLAWAFRLRRVAGAERHFRWAAAMFLFLLLEGFIGAVLVKKELVENDASTSRAIVVGLHLVNTLLLVLCSVVMLLRPTTPAQTLPWRLRPLFTVGLVVILLTSITGAITALGDTLFPTQPALGPELLAKLRNDLSPSHHFLVRLRVVHPLVAATGAIFLGGLFLFAARAAKAAPARQLAQTGLALVALQLVLGYANIALAAPGWMQILHLTMAQALWVVLVLAWWRSAAPATSSPGSATLDPAS